MMCDAKAIYSFSKKLELMLSATNLFNKNTYSYTTYGAISQTTTQRQLRGREVFLTLHIKK